MALHPRIKTAAEQIALDTSSGAAEMTHKAALVFVMLSETGAVDPAALTEEVHTLGMLLIEAQPSMSPVINLVNRVFTALEACAVPREMRLTIGKSAMRFITEIEECDNAISANLLPLLHGGDELTTVLLHSYSSTVLTALLDAAGAGRKIHAVCTESRPGREGVTLVNKLSAGGITATFIVDMLAFEYIYGRKVDMVLVGADGVFQSGLLNKTGTLGLAHCCHDAGVPVYALAGTYKLLPPGLERHQHIKNRPGSEVLDDPPPGTQVVNRYFDLTPLELFTGLVTERGTLSPGEILSELSGSSGALVSGILK